jgi:hypothetical protein
MLKRIRLPRQARDKHRESTRKEMRFRPPQWRTARRASRACSWPWVLLQASPRSRSQVRKRGFVHLFCLNDQFTKTGSGQTAAICPNPQKESLVFPADGSAATVQDVDVPTVQAILVSHFGQQVHVAPPAPPAPRPADAPPWYVVTIF